MAANPLTNEIEISISCLDVIVREERFGIGHIISVTSHVDCQRIGERLFVHAIKGNDEQ